ncbi:hypothetical protein [Streptomyces sp. NPDC086777]|uniref:WD40 repeat domain-containing protein n=1 Tax=Streptomyces sp. NPDC086777 TaxID=3154866 RepID=UPI00344B325B
MTSMVCLYESAARASLTEDMGNRKVFATDGNEVAPLSLEELADLLKIYKNIEQQGDAVRPVERLRELQAFGEKLVRASKTATAPEARLLGEKGSGYSRNAQELEAALHTSSPGNLLLLDDTGRKILEFLWGQVEIRRGLPERILHVCTDCRKETLVNPDYQEMREKARRDLEQDQKSKRIAEAAFQTFLSQGAYTYRLINALTDTGHAGQPLVSFVCPACEGVEAEKTLVAFCPNCHSQRREPVLAICPKCRHDFRCSVTGLTCWEKWQTPVSEERFSQCARFPGVGRTVDFVLGGSCVLGGCEGGELILWSAGESRESLESSKLLWHGESPHGFKLAAPDPQGGQFALCSRNVNVQVYSVHHDRLELIHKFNAGWGAGISSPLEALAFDGRRVITASNEGAMLWDAVSGRKIKTLSFAWYRRHAAISSDGAWIAIAGSHSLAVYSTRAGCSKYFSTKTAEIQGIALHPSIPLVIAACPDNVRMWAIDAGARTPRFGAGQRVPFDKRSHPTGAIAVDPRGEYLAVACKEYCVEIISLHRCTRVTLPCEGDVVDVSLDYSGRIAVALRAADRPESMMQIWKIPPSDDPSWRIDHWIPERG